MVSYSSGLRLPEYSPGTRIYGNQNSCFRAEYANASGGTNASAVITVAAVGAVAGNSFTLYITPAGQAPIEVVYTMPDPVVTGQDFQNSVLAAILAEPRLAGLGTWAATATTVTFAGLEPGQRLAIAHMTNTAQFTVAETVINGTPYGMRIKRSRAVVQDLTRTYPASSDPMQVAMLPSGAGTETWLGVKMGDNIMEATHGHPDYSSYMSTETFIEPQIAVSLYGHIAVDLETPFMGNNPPQLNYRTAADGTNDDLGIFTFETGTGISPVPVGYRLIGVGNNGTVAAVDFDRR